MRVLALLVACYLTTPASAAIYSLQPISFPAPSVSRDESVGVMGWLCQRPPGLMQIKEFPPQHVPDCSSYFFGLEKKPTRQYGYSIGGETYITRQVPTVEGRRWFIYTKQ